MLSLWHAPWFEAAKKFVSSCSLLLFVTAFASADVDYVQVNRRLEAAKTLNARKLILMELYESEEADSDLHQELERLANAWESGYQWAPKQAEEMIRLRARLTQSSSGISAKTAKAQAAGIKANPLYRDPGSKESSNWFGQAMGRLGKLLSNALDLLFRRNTPEVTRPDLSGAEGFFAAIGPVLKMLVYILLAAAMGLFIYLVARHARWKGQLARKATALMEEDEPERSRDEWLEMAHRLTSEGRYREAVRCLYLASLLRFDEAGVARFLRSETNWEHLKRILASPSYPEDLNFRSATQSFDRIWYGFRLKGIEDVEWFRKCYADVSEALTRRAGA